MAYYSRFKKQFSPPFTIDRHLNNSWCNRRVSIVQPRIRVQFNKPFKIIKLDNTLRCSTQTFSVKEFQPISH